MCFGGPRKEEEEEEEKRSPSSFFDNTTDSHPKQEVGIPHVKNNYNIHVGYELAPHDRGLTRCSVSQLD